MRYRMCRPLELLKLLTAAKSFVLAEHDIQKHLAWVKKIPTFKILANSLFEIIGFKLTFANVVKEKIIPEIPMLSYILREKKNNAYFV